MPTGGFPRWLPGCWCCWCGRRWLIKGPWLRAAVSLADGQLFALVAAAIWVPLTGEDGYMPKGARRRSRVCWPTDWFTVWVTALVFYRDFKKNKTTFNASLNIEPDGYELVSLRIRSFSKFFLSTLFWLCRWHSALCARPYTAQEDEDCEDRGNSWTLHKSTQS